MAKKQSNDGWWIGVLLGLVGIGILYYTQTGLGRANDSLLLPNSIEGRIDSLIAALNKRFGKRWIDFGINALRYYVRTTLPPPLVELVDAVTEVEELVKNNYLSGPDKRQLAIQMKRIQ